MAEQGSVLRRVDNPVIEERAVAFVPAKREGHSWASLFFLFLPVKKATQAFEVDASGWVDAEDVAAVAEIRHQE